MKTRSERLKHRRSLPLEFLENRNLLSPVPAGPAAEVRLDQDHVPLRMTFEGTRDASNELQPPDFTTHITLSAEGFATPWGPFHLEENHTLTLTPSDGVLHITDGEATFTLASGQTVTATYTGTGQINPANLNHQEVQLTYIITGGSGPSPGWSGRFEVHVTIEDALTLERAPVTATGTGTIAHSHH